MKPANFSADFKFLKNGGFVYFDDSSSPKPVQIYALDPDPAAGQLFFGEPKKLEREWFDNLWSQDRFRPITIDSYREVGATHFCWIHPDEEVSGGRICVKGGFAYHFSRQDWTVAASVQMT